VTGDASTRGAAEFTPVLLGIHQGFAEHRSFSSAARFQGTTGVLTERRSEGRATGCAAFKENVIIAVADPGRLGGFRSALKRIGALEAGLTRNSLIEGRAAARGGMPNFWSRSHRRDCRAAPQISAKACSNDPSEVSSMLFRTLAGFGATQERFAAFAGQTTEEAWKRSLSRFLLPSRASEMRAC